MGSNCYIQVGGSIIVTWKLMCIADTLDCNCYV
uniref:Uncharacterized protein n=1 Tax=Myoviridae sp. ctqfO1 TaxID=2827710 RepID=A0A8S5T3P5_9CAUD|nr:MAG TPA: hypothetical protein [Myoviridae sp. ctqfO1]